MGVGEAVGGSAVAVGVAVGGSGVAVGVSVGSAGVSVGGISTVFVEAGSTVFVPEAICVSVVPQLATKNASNSA